MEDVAIVGTIFGTLIPIVMFIGFFTFMSIAARASSRRKAEEARVKYEFLQKMTEGASFDTEKYIEFEKAELASRRQRRIGNLRLAGFILTGIGVSAVLFFYFVGSMEADIGWGLSTLGLFPLAVGGALLLASKLESREAAEAQAA